MRHMYVLAILHIKVPRVLIHLSSTFRRHFVGVSSAFRPHFIADDFCSSSLFEKKEFCIKSYVNTKYLSQKELELFDDEFPTKTRRNCEENPRTSFRSELFPFQKGGINVA